MPRWSARNGYALLRRLRANSATNWLPVILLAAEPDESARREALEAGADDYLPKPFGARELLSRVGLHLAMARVGREASEAVRASERRLAEVLEAIGEAVFAIDRDQRILFANRTALAFWNREADEVLGRPLLEVFPEIETGEPYQAYLPGPGDRTPRSISRRGRRRSATAGWRSTPTRRRMAGSSSPIATSTTAGAPRRSCGRARSGCA